MDCRIVTDNGLTVTGGADVKLEALRAVVKRKIEGGQRVFRRIVAGAAMSEQ